MDYNLICFGNYKDNNIRCIECPDKYKCSKEVNSKEVEYDRSEGSRTE